MEGTIDAALLERLKQLRQTRSAKMGVLTRKKNDITELMKDPRNVESVKTKMENEFSKTCNELNEINDAVKTLLNEEGIKKDQSEWYVPKMTSVDEFKNKVSQWVDENEKVTGTDAVGISVTVDDIVPKDSISNVRSRHSARSSIVSLKMLLESEQAELAAKAERLQRKQQLERKESELRAEKEELELETQMAANTAKLSILKEFEMSQSVMEKRSQLDVGDAMNQYLETGLPPQPVQQENDEDNEFEETETTQVFAPHAGMWDSTTMEEMVPNVMPRAIQKEPKETPHYPQRAEVSVRKKNNNSTSSDSLCSLGHKGCDCTQVACR